MARSVALAMISLGLLIAPSAYADIGAVGAPYDAEKAPAAVPSDNPEQTAAAKPAAPAKEEEKPLMEVNFNQNYVSYERAVIKAVDAAQQVNPNMVYDVVSYLPTPDSDSRTKNERMNEEAENNLRGVVNKLRDQGVPASRIRVRAEPYPKSADGQAPVYNKVAIFVR